VDGQKMGKSLNNFITLKQAFAGDHERLNQAYEPLAIRQFILNSHYRSTLDFSDAALYAANSGHQRISETVRALRKQMKAAPEGPLDPHVATQLEQAKARFEEAMNDDLNAAVALSVLFDLVRVTNKTMKASTTTRETLAAIDDLFTLLGGDVLGVVRSEYEPQADTDLTKRYELVVEGMLELRNKARMNRDFARADEIRDILGSVGIALKDTPSGTEWKLL